MTSSLTRFPVRHPWIVVIAWVALVAAASLIARVVVVPETGPAAIPASAPSQRAASVQASAFGSGGQHATAQVIVADDAGIADGDRQRAGDLRQWLASTEGVAGVGPAVPSSDSKALLVPITFADSANLDSSVVAIEDHLASLDRPAEVHASVTGDPVVTHDLTAGALGQGSSGSSPVRLLTLLVILVILALVFRAPLAVAVPLLTIGASLGVSLRLLAPVEHLLRLPINGFSESFAVAVTIGAGTNYGLFLIHRYRQELASRQDRREALALALNTVAHAIVFSASTVVVATGLMAAGQLELFRSLGPAVAFCVAVMLLAGLTLMPALMSISGRALFWPRRPASGESGGRFWRWAGRWVTRHPALAAVTSVCLMVPAALGLTHLQTSFDDIKALPAATPSVQGYTLLDEHYHDQLSSIGLLITGGRSLASEPAALGATANAVAAIRGVGSVSPPVLSPDARTALIDVTLQSDPSSPAAIDAVTTVTDRARSTLAGSDLGGETVMASGLPAANRDQQDLLRSDFLLIAGLVSIAIYAILALVLRNLFAPLYLLASVGASTAAALGIVTWICTAVGEPIFWTTPVFAFVFLVALGEDFNIFLLTRMREEVAKRGLVEGIAEAVAGSGGVITSCGLVMAAAFLLLARSPVLIIQQIGLVVVVGVLLDTFLVRSFLVPALVRLLGSRSGIWGGAQTRPAIGDAA